MNSNENITSEGRVGSPSRPEADHSRNPQENDLAKLKGGSESRPYLRTRKPSRLWLWFVAAFIVQAIVWAAWLTLAARHPVEEVPVVPAQGR